MSVSVSISMFMSMRMHVYAYIIYIYMYMYVSMSMSTSNDVYRYVLMHKFDMGEETYDHVTPRSQLVQRPEQAAVQNLTGFLPSLCAKRTTWLVIVYVYIHRYIYEILLSRI